MIYMTPTKTVKLKVNRMKDTEGQRKAVMGKQKARLKGLR